MTAVPATTRKNRPEISQPRAVHMPHHVKTPRGDPERSKDVTFLGLVCHVRSGARSARRDLALIHRRCPGVDLRPVDQDQAAAGRRLHVSHRHGAGRQFRGRKRRDVFSQAQRNPEERCRCPGNPALLSANACAGQDLGLTHRTGYNSREGRQAKRRTDRSACGGLESRR